MAFIELNDVGKIYTSGQSASIGVHGVRLSFEIGEFVVITGDSGAGKSTLLNIIGGTDTYEEGEMSVNGEKTSHYDNHDRDVYRQKYISFVSQNADIISGFTVLKNVETALIGAQDPKTRRKRALEILRLTGLYDIKDRVASELSGGQRQKTAVAVALAKDSPVICADEPTGNLDSAAADEIVRILGEFSHDRFVIAVTHDFARFERYATRHIELSHSFVSSDRLISRPSASGGERTANSEDSEGKGESALSERARRVRIGRTDYGISEKLRIGVSLGAAHFAATSALSAFMVLLFFVSVTASVLVGTVITKDRNSDYMFTHIPGRVVIVRNDGEMISPEELGKLQSDLGAEDSLLFDELLDYPAGGYECTFGYVGEPDVGRYPQKSNEVLVYAPVYQKSAFSSSPMEELIIPELGYMSDFEVVGIKYFYDNNANSAKLVFTKDGFAAASAINHIYRNAADFSWEYVFSDSVDSSESAHVFSDIYVSFELDAGEYMIAGSVYDELLELKDKREYENEDYFFDIEVGMLCYTDSGSEYIALERSGFLEDGNRSVHRKLNAEGTCILAISPDIALDIVNEYYFERSYIQASLFFEDDETAYSAVEELNRLGYTAVVSDTEAVSSDIDSAADALSVVLLFALAALLIVAICLFMVFCLKKTLLFHRKDISVMRSMGIPSASIKISIFFRTAVAFFIGALASAAFEALMFFIPFTNRYFGFFSPGLYALVFAVFLFVTLAVYKTCARLLFSESVKSGVAAEGEAG